MPSERRPRRPAGLRRAAGSLLGAALLVAASVASAGLLRGDTNCDGRVDQADVDALFAALFGAESDCAGLDVNGDGGISAGDVVALMEQLQSPTATPTETPSTAVTPTVTGSALPTATATALTPSPSPTATPTITITPGGPTLTRTRTGTVTQTPTNSRRPTRTATPSETPTNTRTATRTRSSTRTRTPTATPSPGRTRGTRTDTPTSTPTGPTPTATATCSCTPTVTSAATSTATGPSPTSSRTGTSTRTPSNTRTPSRTGTNTRTPTHTRTPTGTRAPTNTRTPTATRPPSPTRTDTRTLTPSRTRTVTRTPTATIPRPFGPEITYFGIATADNRVLTPTGQTDDGVPIFDFPNDFGFIIVGEGRPGTSRVALAACGLQNSLAGQCQNGRSAAQLIFGRALGNGSAAVCDTSPPNIGGVPAVASLTFDQSPMVTDAINDIGCRLDTHPTTEGACTLDELGNYSWVHYVLGDPTNTTMQYCSAPVVGSELSFSSGITRVKLQIQDNAGNVGNQAEIAIRVP